MQWGCEKFWVSVDLESPNDLYHLARVLGRWDVSEGWHGTSGCCSVLECAERAGLVGQRMRVS
jgi:hypothetical protein